MDDGSSLQGVEPLSAAVGPFGGDPVVDGGLPHLRPLLRGRRGGEQELVVLGRELLALVELVGDLLEVVVGLVLGAGAPEGGRGGALGERLETGAIF